MLNQSTTSTSPAPGFRAGRLHFPLLRRAKMRRRAGSAGSEAERALIARAQRGDEEAFATLYSAYKRRVYSLCLRMIHSEVDAEDLTQEAFLHLFRKIDSFRGDAAFGTWLHRLVVN